MGTDLAIVDNVGKELLETQLLDALSQLPAMSDDQIENLGAMCMAAERFAFRLRGAACAELMRRCARKLSGGRGKRDDEGAGVEAHLHRLAGIMGCDCDTLRVDIRIYETLIARETADLQTGSLPREFYRAALMAPDPLAALLSARRQLDSGDYSAAEFRRYVRRLNARPVCPPADDIFWVRVGFQRDDYRALTDYVHREQRSVEDVVVSAVRLLMRQ